VIYILDTEHLSILERDSPEAAILSVRLDGVSGETIAAIALANHATLLTSNLSDFRQAPGLTVEDWSV